MLESLSVMGQERYIFILFFLFLLLRLFFSPLLPPPFVWDETSGATSAHRPGTAVLRQGQPPNIFVSSVFFWCAVFCPMFTPWHAVGRASSRGRVWIGGPHPQRLQPPDVDLCQLPGSSKPTWELKCLPPYFLSENLCFALASAESKAFPCSRKTRRQSMRRR